MIQLSSEKIRSMTDAEIRAWIDSCEKRFDRELDQVAAAILESGVSLVSLAGPSCSGKTTTAHRLISLLEKAGKHVKVLSTDDFFHNVSHFPVIDGEAPDFDSYDRLNHTLLRRTLRGITEGCEVGLPVFDFLTGVRTDNVESYRPQTDGLVILEGIHALNDDLYGADMRFFRLGLNVRQDVSLDGVELFRARQIRLMRRIIRDEKFRGYSAPNTLFVWDNVHKGEIHYIYPFLQKPDAFISTGLEYEPCVWKEDALNSLQLVEETHPCYAIAREFSEKLRALPAIDPAYVPETSLLREFIG